MNSLSFLLTISSSILASEAALRGSPTQKRILSTDGEGFQGACTVNNFIDLVGEKPLEDILGVGDDKDAMQIELTNRCTAALAPQIDLSDTIEKGPQFMKNFFDGGTTWNDNYEKDGSYVLQEDAAIIKMKYDAIGRSVVFDTPDGGTSAHYEQYFSNFFKGDQECPLGVIECCYTSSRTTDSLVGNAQMCALDMTNSARSNHIKARSFTVYDTQPNDDTYCSGFAYEKDSFGESVKYNTLFHMAMMTNLYENGRVKNVPGAPMCGCVSQMPMIDQAACVKPIEGYSMDSDGVVHVNLSWEDCGDLKTYYNSLEDRTDVEKYFVNSQIVGEGKCAEGAKSFLNDQMLVAIEN